MPRSGATTAAARVAYDVLRRRILDGDFQPGQHLVGAELGSELQMSRTPVREALIMLEKDGLVVGALNKGFTVSTITAQDIAQLYELRALLESFGARKAAERAAEFTVGDIEQMRSVLDELDGHVDHIASSDRALDQATIGEMERLNREFHDALHRKSGQSVLEELLATLGRTSLDEAVYRAFDRLTIDFFKRANEFHRLILERVLEADSDRAAALMYEHVLQSRDLVVGAVDQAGGQLSDLTRAVHGDGSAAFA